LTQSICSTGFAVCDLGFKQFRGGFPRFFGKEVITWQLVQLNGLTMQRDLVLSLPMMVAKICSRTFPQSTCFKSLKEGQKVTFEVVQGPKGKQASNIQAP
jgi:hypothetical protein